LEEKRKPTFDEYLAGGALGNSPLLLFTYIAKLLWPDEAPSIGLEIPAMLAVLLGGVSAGYLVMRRTDQDYLQTGFKVGVSTFIVNLALSSIIFQSASIAYSLWILLLFSCSSVMGSYLRTITVQKPKINC
jgi:hypothetical protein